jgi:hypothetical protein
MTDPMIDDATTSTATTSTATDATPDPTAEPPTVAPPPGEPFDGGANADAASDPAAEASVLGSFQDAVEDLTERAGPTVREFTARSAEVAAIAADKAGPFARRAGEVTADASIRLAERARAWAADIRASLGEADTGAGEPREGPASETRAEPPE